MSLGLATAAARPAMRRSWALCSLMGKNLPLLSAPYPPTVPDVPPVLTVGHGTPLAG